MRWAAKAHGVEAIVDLDSMRVLLRKDGRHWTLHPRFLGEINGVTRYFSRFTDESTHLAGWTFALNAGWPAAKDKLVFKRGTMALGLRVPEFSRDSGARLENVVVKRAVGSFGEHVHGPFRSSTERPLRTSEGEYYERFIEGRHLKVWYWGEQLITLERDQAPTAVGDGASTVRALIHEYIRGQRRMTPEKTQRILERCETVLRYDGASLDDVLAPGQRQRIEFRYGTEVMKDSDRQRVDPRADGDPQWDPLREAGPRLLQLVPPPLREHQMFAVDAIQDAEGEIWLLEMNSHPTVHPLVYDPMIRSLTASAPAMPAPEASGYIA